MSYTIPPRLTSILAEATRLAPKRRTSSDGTLGDSAHRAEHSDHNPEDDPGWPVKFIVHAVDVSESKPGTPYWQPFFDIFDVHAWQRTIAAEYVAANPAVRLQRWPWLARGGYMVGFDGRVDVIFNPSVSLDWRQNGAPKQEHNQHGHFSIGHNAPSEADTQPIFVDSSAPPPKPEPVPSTVTITIPEDDVEQTDLSMRLDNHGNGWKPLPGVKAKDVRSFAPIGIPDPAKHGYATIPLVSLTIGEDDKLARLVVEHGTPGSTVTVRVVHA